MKYRIVKRGEEWFIEHKSIGGTGVHFWDPVCQCATEEWANHILKLLNGM